MKNRFQIGLITGNIILIILIIILIFELNSEKLAVINNHSTNNSKASDSFLIYDNNGVKAPEYIPPQDGSSNKFWSGHWHKFLLKDRESYFGKGQGKMNREGQKQNKSDE